MDFKIAHAAPVGIKLNGTDYLLPKMRVRDWIDYGAKIDAKRLADATAGLSPSDRYKLLSVIPMFATSFRQLVNHSQSVEGASLVIRTCAARVKMPDDQIDLLLDNAVPDDLLALSALLSGLVDDVVETDSEPKKEGQSDPLASTPAESTT